MIMSPNPSVSVTYATHIIGRYLPVFDVTNPEKIDPKAVPSEKVSILCTQRESAEGKGRVKCILDSSASGGCSEY